MSIFGTIASAIFGRKAAAVAAPGDAASPAPGAIAAPAATASAPVVEMPASLLAVATRLGAMPGAEKLNWHTSIVDLMKLLGIDSSLANREQLAKELGYRGPLDGSAEMNIWLHKATMAKLAENGGSVPREMLN